MIPNCEYCGEPLDLLEGDEMGSAIRRYRCRRCLLTYVMDAGGMLVEDD